MPPWYLLLVPIAGIVIPFAFLKQEIWVSVCIGLLAALIVYEPYLPYDKKMPKLTTAKKIGSRYKLVTTAGIAMAGVPILMIMNNGLATAISMSNGFAVIEQFFQNLPFSPLINLALIGTILTGIASGPAGFLLGLEVAANRLRSHGNLRGGLPLSADLHLHDFGYSADLHGLPDADLLGGSKSERGVSLCL